MMNNNYYSYFKNDNLIASTINFFKFILSSSMILVSTSTICSIQKEFHHPNINSYKMTSMLIAIRGTIKEKQHFNKNDIVMICYLFTVNTHNLRIIIVLAMVVC